jgi:hypothetical protein
MLVHYHCLQLPAQILCISQPQNTEISENMQDKKSSPTKDIITFKYQDFQTITSLYNTRLS